MWILSRKGLLLGFIPASRAFSLLAVVLCCVLPASVSAVEFRWNNPSGGNFELFSNWTPFGFPNNGNDSARFGILGTYTVDFDNNIVNNNLLVASGTVTFDLSEEGILGITFPRNYTLDEAFGTAVNVSGLGSFPAKLIVEGVFLDGFRSTMSVGSRTVIGEFAGNGGTLELETVLWDSSGETISVGSAGVGVMSVDSSSVVRSGETFIGSSPGSMGTVNVQGHWANTGNFHIGTWSTGILGITSTGTVTVDNDLTIAELASSNSSAFVNGLLHVKNDAYVGGRPLFNGGTGRITVSGGGRLMVDGQLTIRDDGIVDILDAEASVLGNLQLDGGSLFSINDVGADVFVNSISGSGAIVFSAGDLEVNSDIDIDEGSPFGSVMNITNSKTLTANGTVRIGDASSAAVTVDATDVSSFGLTIGSTDPADGGSSLTIGGTPGIPFVPGTADPGNWMVDGGGNGRFTVASAAFANVIIEEVGRIEHTGEAHVAHLAGTSANIRVETGGIWQSHDDIFLGGIAAAAGSGELNIESLGVVSAIGTMKVWDDFTVNVADGGFIETNLLDVSGLVTFGGNVDLSGGDLFLKGFALNGGTVVAPAMTFGTNTFTGFGSLVGNADFGGDLAPSGDLVVGNPDSFSGVVVDGHLAVGSHTVTLEKKGFFALNDFSMNGGTLNAANGVLFNGGTGAVVNGVINARAAIDLGHFLEANGNLTIGDSGSLSGYFSDGELVTNQHTVTLDDANQAVLGSLTTLGNGTDPGALVADNGLLLEFGKNVAGFGMIDTPDDPTTPFTNNGALVGTSAAQPLTVSGYVKGVGTADNVVFTGTVNGGFSPATVNFGSVIWAGTLVAELGGTTAGTEHDQYVHSGTANLGGTLRVELIDDSSPGYAPSLGDVFVILTAAEILSDFAAFELPSLAPGLTWSISNDGLSYALSVAAVPLPAALPMFIAGLVGLLGAVRRRRDIGD